jgi:hypothetical protein
MNAITVELPRQGIGQIAMPHGAGSIWKRQHLRRFAGVGTVEQAQIDPFGMSAVERKIDAATIETGTERIGLARPQRPESVDAREREGRRHLEVAV